MAKQTLGTAAPLIAPECETMSKARDRPIRGALRQPPRLRSRQHPTGLPRHRRVGGKLWATMQKGNNMASSTARWIRALRAKVPERGWAVDNPAHAYMWLLDEHRALE